MSQRLRAIALALMIGSVGFPTSSQADPPSKLSWEACVQEAAAQNPDLRAARASYEASLSQARGARGSFLPSLSGNLGYSYGNSSSSTFSSNPDTNTAGLTTQSAKGRGSYTANLSLSQGIFSGLSDLGKLRQDQASARASQAGLRIAEAKMAFELVTAFEGLTYAQAYIHLAEQIAARRQDDLKLVELRFESGRENKGSVLLSRANLDQAKLDQLEAQHELEVARTELAKALGREEVDSVEVTGEVPVSDPPSKAPDFKSLALSTPEYAQSVASSESADAAVTVARSAFFPSLNLVGTYARQGADFFPSNERWTVGAGISFPLFRGGKDYYATQSALSSRSAADLTRVSVSRQALLKLRQAYNSFVESVAKLQVDLSFEKAASVRAEIARSQYNNGLITFEDWDLIENDLIGRQKSLLQSRKDRVLAEASWNQARGQGVLPQ
jgi:outer membrane protein TolC